MKLPKPIRDAWTEKLQMGYPKLVILIWMENYTDWEKVETTMERKIKRKEIFWIDLHQNKNMFVNATSQTILQEAPNWGGRKINSYPAKINPLGPTGWRYDLMRI